jgi:sec-independent protein translocase protein TatC
MSRDPGEGPDGDDEPDESGTDSESSPDPGADSEEPQETQAPPDEASGAKDAEATESDGAEEPDGAEDEVDADEGDKAEAEETEAADAESDAEDGDDDDWKAGQTAIDRKTGPAEDEEQPLTEHIEEMVKRVAVVLFIAGVVSLAAFPFGEEFINFLWYSVLPSDISQPHVYHPMELIVTQLKAASLLGIVLALPVFVYQTYAFMRPGLYPHERRYYLAAVPTSLVLAFVGLLFGYFLILPAVMTYFMQYSRNVVDIAFALGETFTLMLVLLGFLAVVFQIPLFIMLAIMMGLTTRTWLEDKRLIMWGIFLGIAFLFSPDPTGMAPFLIALTMVGLYEGTLLLLRWTGRGD